MFSLAKQDDSKVTLHCLKQGQVYDLLTSEQSPCLAFDSYFRVLQANKAVFMKEKDEFDLGDDSEDDEVKKAFQDKEYVKVVVCTSGSNEKSMMFTLTKDRKEEDNTIENMRLILNEENIKELEVDQTEDDHTPVHSFYITSEEFGDD